MWKTLRSSIFGSSFLWINRSVGLKCIRVSIQRTIKGASHPHLNPQSTSQSSTTQLQTLISLLSSSPWRKLLKSQSSNADNNVWLRLAVLLSYNISIDDSINAFKEMNRISLNNLTLIRSFPADNGRAMEYTRVRAMESIRTRSMDEQWVWRQKDLCRMSVEGITYWSKAPSSPVIKRWDRQQVKRGDEEREEGKQESIFCNEEWGGCWKWVFMLMHFVRYGGGKPFGC